MKIYQSQDGELHYNVSGNPDAQPVLWAHGWGQSHAGFDALIPPFENSAHHYAIDFPGFGASPEPSAPWGTDDYADFIAEFIRAEIKQPVIWIGHSFGCRVALQITSRYPDLIKGLCLIAGAGLPRKRPLFKRLYLKIRIYSYKFLKKLSLINLVSEEWLKSKFGSSDYKNASGIIRQIFVKVVNEDLSQQAKMVNCPVTLIYGKNDSETPPEIGHRLNRLIKDSEMVLLRDQDHYSVLSSGRHQVTPILKKFFERFNAGRDTQS